MDRPRLSLDQTAEELLGRLDGGAPLSQVLEGLILQIEAASHGGMLGSILLLDEDGRRLLHGAAPSLPEAYSRAIHGIEIGPKVGSCGTAAYLGHAVYVTDVSTDPLWEDFRDLALSHGLRACWSTPIVGEAGEVLGTFAIYHRTPRTPTPDELELTRAVSAVVARAIARAHRPA
jgi:GAF domain-containing protein